MRENPSGDELEWDLVDRLHKALRVGQCKPGEMTEILGVSPATMTNYLGGKTRPKDGMLRQWALRCGVSAAWLISGIIEAGPDDGPGLDAPYPPWDSNPEPADCGRVIPLREAA